MHFSPAVRPLLQADRPEWSVASDAEVPRTKWAGRRWALLTGRRQRRAGRAGTYTPPTGFAQ